MKKPSVTELLKILNKPKLMYWANKLGLKGQSLSDYSKIKKMRGSEHHMDVELYLKNGEIRDESSSRLMIEFFNNFNVLKVEEKIECEYFQGRVDLLLEKDNVKYVVDMKTNFKKPYLDHYLQLNAYKMCIDSDEIAILSIPDFTMTYLSNSNEDKYVDLLKQLSNIYKTLKTIENE